MTENLRGANVRDGSDTAVAEKYCVPIVEELSDGVSKQRCLVCTEPLEAGSVRINWWNVVQGMPGQYWNLRFCRKCRLNLAECLARPPFIDGEIREARAA